jgi:hypothetical protein
VLKIETETSGCRAQFLQLPELHGTRHGAFHLQLALHKQLLRVGCAGHHGHKVALAHGDAAVTLVHFALARTASAVLQINHPLLSVAASDVPLVNSLNLANNVGVLRQLLSKHSKNVSSGGGASSRADVLPAPDPPFGRSSVLQLPELHGILKAQEIHFPSQPDFKKCASFAPMIVGAVEPHASKHFPPVFFPSCDTNPACCGNALLSSGFEWLQDARRNVFYQNL